MNQSQPMQLRVLVVDDETSARERLIQLLRKDPQVAEALEASSGISAIDLVQAERPDIVFLDVQMPLLDGFGVIQALGAKDMPHTVFVTAYERYAVRAFEADAADYLLKPFSDERFVQAMTRVKARVRNRESVRLGPNVSNAASTYVRANGLWDRLVVRSGGITRIVAAHEIDWIEAADVYVNVHVQGKEYLYREPLRQLEERLDPARFVRIHRSTIVNIEKIKQLEPISHGEYEVVMIDEARLQLSRRFRKDLEMRLGQSL